LGEQEDESLSLREPVANLLASRILLPSRWFCVDVTRLWGDLLQLKSIHSTASHELIAYRMLDLPDAGIITVFNQGQPSRRRANGFVPAPGLHPLERGASHEPPCRIAGVWHDGSRLADSRTGLEAENFANHVHG
jgi:hypothetical protein